jgi:hypothetical protein
MLTPTNGAVDQHAPPPLSAAVDALAASLRSTYQAAHEPAHKLASQTIGRFETADGTTIDAAYAADIAGCRAVTAALPATVHHHLPGAHLVEWLDDSPAVIDSRWRYHNHEIVIEWNYEHDFGDPEALTVRAVAR